MSDPPSGCYNSGAVLTAASVFTLVAMSVAFGACVAAWVAVAVLFVVLSRRSAAEDRVRRDTASPVRLLKAVERGDQ